MSLPLLPTAPSPALPSEQKVERAREDSEKTLRRLYVGSMSKVLESACRGRNLNAQAWRSRQGHHLRNEKSSGQESQIWAIGRERLLGGLYDGEGPCHKEATPTGVTIGQSCLGLCNMVVMWGEAGEGQHWGRDVTSKIEEEGMTQECGSGGEKVSSPLAPKGFSVQGPQWSQACQIHRSLLWPNFSWQSHSRFLGYFLRLHDTALWWFSSSLGTRAPHLAVPLAGGDRSLSPRPPRLRLDSSQGFGYHLCTNDFKFRLSSTHLCLRIYIRVSNSLPFKHQMALRSTELDKRILGSLHTVIVDPYNVCPWAQGSPRARTSTELELFTPVHVLFICSHPRLSHLELITVLNFRLVISLCFFFNSFIIYIFMPKRDIFLVSVVIES